MRFNDIRVTEADKETEFIPTCLEAGPSLRISDILKQTNIG